MCISFLSDQLFLKINKKVASVTVYFFLMSTSHNWVVYSPKIMTKRRRKCKLRCESIVVILVISLYSILSWYQVKDLQDYYAALGNFCAFSLYFYALI